MDRASVGWRLKRCRKQSKNCKLDEVRSCETAAVEMVDVGSSPVSAGWSHRPAVELHTAVEMFLPAAKLLLVAESMGWSLNGKSRRIPSLSGWFAMRNRPKVSVTGGL